ncbi:hypothetical protein CRG98_050040, partial [Punica granatum]
ILGENGIRARKSPDPLTRDTITKRGSPQGTPILRCWSIPRGTWPVVHARWPVSLGSAQGIRGWKMALVRWQADRY